MAGSAIKTGTTEADAMAFLAAVPDPRRREEAQVLDGLHRKVTAHAPRMWGPSIVGYGSYRYRYASGREGVACRAGFSPRKPAATIYLLGEFGDRQPEADALFARLGPHSLGKACLYLKRLDKVDLAVLEQLVAMNWDVMNATWPDSAEG